MTQPEKDEVLKNPSQANSGGSSIPSSSGAAAKQDTRSKGASSGAPSDGEAATKGQGKVVTPDILEEAEAVVGAAEASVDELVEKAQNETQEWKDKFMRLHAEWDTYRRRTAEQRQEERASATEKLVENLLPVIDDFERTIDYAEKNGEGELLDGVQAVHAKLVDTLVKQGVEVLHPQNDAFDALEHQAVSTIENKQVPDETVSDVYQKGYKMGKKVLRPAMVVVATGGPKREVPEEKNKDE